MTTEEALIKYQRLASFAAFKFIRAYPRLWPLTVGDLTNVALETIWRTVEEVPGFTKGLLSFRVYNRLSRYLRHRKDEQPGISLTQLVPYINHRQDSEIETLEEVLEGGIDPERIAIAREEISNILSRPDLGAKIALLTAMGYLEKEMEDLLPIKVRQIRKYKRATRAGKEGCRA